MFKSRSRIWRGISVAVICLSAVFVLTAAVSLPRQSALADPPEGQTYTGAKECASCHFKQYMTWKKDKHAKTFDLLTDKYKTDAKCLKCHTTGHGEATGFKDIATTPNLAGTTCEACHGPGSKHGEIAKSYGKKKLTEAEEKLVRDSIWMMLPKNICVECHVTKAHKKSETPAELKPKK